jgi:hypothetical protein
MALDLSDYENKAQEATKAFLAIASRCHAKAKGFWQD